MCNISNGKVTVSPHIGSIPDHGESNSLLSESSENQSEGSDFRSNTNSISSISQATNPNLLSQGYIQRFIGEKGDSFDSDFFAEVNPNNDIYLDCTLCPKSARRNVS